MSTKEKLIERFCRLPKDFSFEELVRSFGYFGYRLDNKGLTSGSRIGFIKGDDKIYLHKPHPGNIILKATMKDIYKLMRKRKLI